MSIGKAQERINDIVDFAIPGKARVLTKEEIAAEYDERATRPIPTGYTGKRGVLHKMNVEAEKRFIVYRVHETSKRESMSAHLTWEQADAEAGRLRDAMTDEECGKDFTYEAKERTRRPAKMFKKGNPGRPR